MNNFVFHLVDIVICLEVYFLNNKHNKQIN